MSVAKTNHSCFAFFIVYSTYFFFLGKEDDGPEGAEAVRIVQKCRRSGGDYRTLSEADQAVLVTLLQDNRNARNGGSEVVGNQLQDIRITTDKIASEVSISRFVIIAHFVATHTVVSWQVSTSAMASNTFS
jgi:hypothetical protein